MVKAVRQPRGNFAGKFFSMVQLGLKENWYQFSLLVLVNAFVGGMIGMERAILPEIAAGEFKMAANTAILSFIVVFGIVKAISNYFTGRFANRIGKKKLLVTGWLFGIPVPFILMYAPDWNWIVAANILLGINQGLTWSATIMMKIDLVGEKQRGLAMGLNEFAGYISVATVAFLTGWIASVYGLRPYPFYIGVLISFLGLMVSWLMVKDTRHHQAREAAGSGIGRLQRVFWETSWKNHNLGAITQAGLVNNLNDGMVWGLLPIMMAVKNFDIREIGIVAAVYPAVWGMGQIITGKMADHFSKRKLIFWGMLLQALCLALFIPAESFLHFVALAAALGWGTAMVYPTFLAAIAENTHPLDRSRSLGVFRFWRDLGYAVGAVITGILADRIGIRVSVLFIAALTFVSGWVVWGSMTEGSNVQKVKSLRV